MVLLAHAIYDVSGILRMHTEADAAEDQRHAYPCICCEGTISRDSTQTNTNHTSRDHLLLSPPLS